MTTVRIDKWLWAARFFKTRALASDACDLGRIESNRHRAKASRDVRVGDRLRITNEAGTYEIDVLGLSEARGPAAVAQTLYRESDESKAERARVAAERKQMLEMGGFADARPNKRDRRELSKLRRRIHPFT
jgi:ribosome-associated heat shock protein Hsp15